MTIIDPRKPQMVELNGQPIDASMAGLVDSQNRPLKRGKGDKLLENKKKRELEIRARKTAHINDWVGEQLESVIPEKQRKKVTNKKEADKLLDKYRLAVMTFEGESVDFCCIVQGKLFGPPQLIAHRRWNWKK